MALFGLGKKKDEQNHHAAVVEPARLRQWKRQKKRKTVWG